MYIIPQARLLDAKRSPSKFYRARRAETAYAARLRSIADHIGRLIRRTVPITPAAARKLEALMRRYSEDLTPWARNTAWRMLGDVSRRDAAMWSELSHGMSRSLNREIAEAPIGERMRELLWEQVELIKSIPIEAAHRVHHLTLQGMLGAKRPAELVDEIMRSGDVARSRATMIARTEVARTATTLVQARSEYVGSTHYIWRTVGDADVRPSHRRLNGKVFAWARPPLCDPPNYHAHAGAIFNCRCWPEPIIGEER